MRRAAIVLVVTLAGCAETPPAPSATPAPTPPAPSATTSSTPPPTASAEPPAPPPAPAPAPPAPPPPSASAAASAADDTFPTTTVRPKPTEERTILTRKIVVRSNGEPVILFSEGTRSEVTIHLSGPKRDALAKLADKTVTVAGTMTEKGMYESDLAVTAFRMPTPLDLDLAREGRHDVTLSGVLAVDGRATFLVTESRTPFEARHRILIHDSPIAQKLADKNGQRVTIVVTTTNPLLVREVK